MAFSSDLDSNCDILRLSASGARRRAGFCAVLAAALFVYPLLLDIPLLDPDEGLHAAIAQEMAVQGDCITPRLLGVPFSDKPILFFWAQAASLRLFGMNEAAVRAPGLLFGLLGSLTTLLLGWRWFGRGPGLLAGAFHMTLLVPLMLAQLPVHDVALVCWTNLVLLAFWEADHAVCRAGAIRHFVLAGVWLGLAILSKGLIGTALVGLGYGAYLVVTRRLRTGIILGMLTALLVGACVAAPWYMLMEWQNPGYCYYYFVQRHLLGYVTGTQRHGGAPLWYYLIPLLGGGLPWIAALPAALRDLVLRRREVGLRLDSPRILCWVFLFSGLLFLSSARSKLWTYALPLFPAVALLAADTWDRCLRGMLAPSCRRLLAWSLGLAWVALAGALPLGLVVVQQRLGLHFGAAAWTACLTLAVAALLPTLLLWLGQEAWALRAAMLEVAGIFLFAMTAVMPRVANEYSGRELARHFNRAGHLPSRLLVLEERVGSLIFYLDPALRVELEPDQVHYISVADLCELLSVPADALVVLPRNRERFAGQRLDLPATMGTRVGHYRVFAAEEVLHRRRP